MHSLANSHGKIVLMLDMQHSIWVTSSALVSSSWFWAEYSAEESSSLSWILVSGLDVSSNLISSLSQTIQQYLALSKWTMCELDNFPIFFKRTIIWKSTENPRVDGFNGKKRLPRIHSFTLADYFARWKVYNYCLFK